MKPFRLIYFGVFLLISVAWLWSGPAPPLFAADGSVRILFIGDSLSAGLGVEPEQAYPALIHDMLKEQGVPGAVVTNGSISGSTTAGALARLKWFLRVKPDILVLALGANDGLRGLSTSEMARNLDKTIVLAKEKNIRVILAGMKLPPNYGLEYARAFQAVYVRLADQHKIPFIPFLLKDVAGRVSLNQSDGIHPNREGHRIIAATVFPYILEQL
ncbi:arylesterase [Desulfobacula sp.]|uniref:arylesterase n=1 Tax=Desulfobacula sp. TaxID=2593537 RepID=UPI00261E376B|nr:arylesterase [Desulfobacula sp.]